MIDIASVGGAISEEELSQVPLVNLTSPLTDTHSVIPGIQDLPPELQPSAGDILLSRAFWPWEDLGALSVPESWLYMGRRVEGVIAQLAVQTDAGPKLVKAQPDGTLNVGAITFPDQPLLVDPMPRASNAPGQVCWSIDASLVANGSATILGGQATGWDLFHVYLQVDAVAAAIGDIDLMEGPAGTMIARFSNASTVQQDRNLRGIAVSNFTSVIIKNFSASTSVVRGVLYARVH